MKINLQSNHDCLQKNYQFYLFVCLFQAHFTHQIRGKACLVFIIAQMAGGFIAGAAVYRRAKKATK